MLATTPVLRQLKQIRDAAASSGPERPRGGDGEPGAPPVVVTPVVVRAAVTVGDAGDQVSDSPMPVRCRAPGAFRSLDLVLDTTGAELDIAPYLRTLAVDGTHVLAGISPKPLTVDPLSLIVGEKRSPAPAPPASRRPARCSTSVRRTASSPTSRCCRRTSSGRASTGWSAATSGSASCST
jgi:hypothetical protein